HISRADRLGRLHADAHYGGSLVNGKRDPTPERLDSFIKASLGGGAGDAVQCVYSDAVTGLQPRDLRGEHLAEDLTTPEQISVECRRAAGFRGQVHAQL